MADARAGWQRLQQAPCLLETNLGSLFGFMQNKLQVLLNCSVVPALTPVPVLHAVIW